MGNPILRVRLHQQQKGKCHYCKVQMSIKVEGLFFCTIDHKKTRSRGGGSHPDNVVGACFRCNNLRGDIPYWAFKQYIELYGPVNVRETLKSLSRDEYLRNHEMWDAIRTKANYVRFRPPIELKAPITVVPPPPLEGFKPRRAILHLTRRNIKEIVDAIPFDQRNLLWGRYLKQERLNEKRTAQDYIQDGSGGSGRSGGADHEGGRIDWSDASYFFGGVWTAHGSSGSDLPAPA